MVNAIVNIKPTALILKGIQDLGYPKPHVSTRKQIYGIFIVLYNKEVKASLKCVGGYSREQVH